MVSKVEKVVEIPQVQYIDKVVDIPVQKQARRQLQVMSFGHAGQSLPRFDSPNLPGLEQVNVPMITQVEKIVEIPQVEHLGLAVGGWLFEKKKAWNLKTQVFRFYRDRIREESSLPKADSL